MQSNMKITGRAVFSDRDLVKDRELKLFCYLVCRANLRNKPRKGHSEIRIFQQRDIVLSQIQRVLGFEPRTTKKYWEQLEEAGLIRFCPHGWDEDMSMTFNQRWTIRNKHKDTYYEIPSNEFLYRKVPKETLVKLNEELKVPELFLKTYITLINYQEECIINGRMEKKFTYTDLRDMLNYDKQDKTNKKFEHILNYLSSLGLIEIEKSSFINNYGSVIPCFYLKQVNFYIDYDIMDFETGIEKIVESKIIKRVAEETKKDMKEIQG